MNFKWKSTTSDKDVFDVVTRYLFDSVYKKYYGQNVLFDVWDIEILQPDTAETNTKLTESEKRLGCHNTI